MQVSWTLFPAAILCLFVQAASAQELWFAPNDNLPRGPNRNVVLNEDFPHLFDEDAQWGAQIDVFLASPMMSGPAGPEDELHHMAAFLQQRHIKLAMGVDATTMDSPKPAPDACGRGVEGSRPPGQNRAIFQRLKRLGLDITYAAMDEPLTFGHYFQGKAGCRYSIGDTARRAAAAIAEIKESYPNIKVVDFEAPPPTSLSQWRSDFEIWLTSYRDAAGTPLDAVMFDVNLFGNWRNTAATGVNVARRQGLRAGILIFKPGPGRSDAEATADYRRAITAVDASKMSFDIIEIANWTPHPFKNLPESDPMTLTYVLNEYNRTHGRK